MKNFIKYVCAVKWQMLILTNCIFMHKLLTKYIDSLNIRYLLIIVLLIILSVLMMYYDKKYPYKLSEEEIDEKV